MPVEIIVRPTLGSYTARAKGHKVIASRSEGARQAAEALVRKLDLGAGQLQEQPAPDLSQGKQRFLFVSTYEMTDKNLLPCPFCGQQDAFVEQLDSDASVVICQGRVDEYSACLARGPVGVQQHEGEDQPGHDQAVKEWNNRAAEQHQGEPAALPARMPAGNITEPHHPWAPGVREGWNKCLDEIAKLGPLYPHADPGEVERLRAELAGLRQHKTDYMEAAEETRKALLAQLAERDALLLEIVEQVGPTVISHRRYMEQKEGCTRLMKEVSGPRWLDKAGKLVGVDAFLVASAEPYAPAERERCSICDDLGDQCMTCEESEFRAWACRHFAAADFKQTAAGVFVRDWMRHSYAAWCARGAIESSPAERDERDERTEHHG